MSAAVAAAALAASMRLVASHAYAEGAPPGFSGGFKEESCHACHFHAEPNTPPGRLMIEGVPARFELGHRYVLTITLTRDDMKRAGFQLAARFRDSGAQAGTLAVGPDDGERIRLETTGGVHTRDSPREDQTSRRPASRAGRSSGLLLPPAGR